MVVTLQVYVSCIKSRSGLIINLSTAVADHHRLGEFTARLHHHCYIIIIIIIISNHHHQLPLLLQHPHPQGQLLLLKDSKKTLCKSHKNPMFAINLIHHPHQFELILSSFERECIFSTGLILFIPACCEFLKFYKLIINMVIVRMMINESQCFESQC